MRNFRFISIITLLCISGTAAFARPSIKEELPEAYQIFREAVYHNVMTEEEVDELYKAARQDAVDNYEVQEKETLLAMCCFLKGMDLYFRQLNDKAGDVFDEGVEHIQAAMDISENSMNLSVYAYLIVHNASVKTFSYQILWIPRVPGIAKKAVKLDPQYVPARIALYSFDCLIPWPYGDYKQGVKDIATLLKPEWNASSEDIFYIGCYAGYTCYKLDRYKDALKWYKKALALYPKNKDVLRSVKTTKKEMKKN